ncbi:MAG TPA: SprB repeat-containing protein, partial [Flavobacteriales bacterium]|nr:SprB repeat-containing protein [Flavobacteriales bacterium]
MSIFILIFGSFIISKSSDIILNDSCNLSLSSVTDVVCFGANDGSITVVADSGSGIYHYYLEMYNSSFPLNGGWQSVGQVPAPGQYTSVTTIPFTSLPADTFRVILEDTVNQCFDTIGFPVLSILVNEPTEIVITENTTNATNITTFDGNASLNVSGGVSPYQYSWTGPNGFTSALQNINNLQSGIYYYSVTDSSGCVISDSVQILATQACSFGTYNSVPPICFGDGNGQIQINSVFGTPQYNYLLEMYNPANGLWIQVNNIFVADTFTTFNNLYAGTYQYTVTDSSACMVTSPQINV